MAPCSTSAWHWSSHAAHQASERRHSFQQGQKQFEAHTPGHLSPNSVCRSKPAGSCLITSGQRHGPMSWSLCRRPICRGGRWWARSPCPGAGRQEVHPPSLVEKWRPEARSSSLGARTVRACESLKHSSVPHLGCFSSPHFP